MHTLYIIRIIRVHSGNCTQYWIQCPAWATVYCNFSLLTFFCMCICWSSAPPVNQVLFCSTSQLRNLRLFWLQSQLLTLADKPYGYFRLLQLLWCLLLAFTSVSMCLRQTNPHRQNWHNQEKMILTFQEKTQYLIYTL